MQLFGANRSSEVGLMFWNLLKDYECHKILEQYMQDKSRTEFEVTLAPVGSATLKLTDGEWELTNFKMSDSFKRTLNETLRCGESNLFRELSEKNMTRLNNYLEKYAGGQYT